MKRRFQFRLVSLIAIVSLVALFFAWRVYDSEANIVAEVEAAGGTAYYEYQQPHLGGFFRPDSTSPNGLGCFVSSISIDQGSTAPPKELSELFFGRHRSRRVAAVELSLDAATTEMLSNLSQLPGLKHLLIEVSELEFEPGSEETEQLSKIKKAFGEVMTLSVTHQN